MPEFRIRQCAAFWILNSRFWLLNSGLSLTHDFFFFVAVVFSFFSGVAVSFLVIVTFSTLPDDETRAVKSNSLVSFSPRVTAVLQMISTSVAESHLAETNVGSTIFPTFDTGTL